MENNNKSVTIFYLKGFTEDRHIQLLLYAIFLGMYIMSLLGNTCMIALIQIDPGLNTPMYFFLNNLSFLDISYTSVIAPQTLTNLLTNNKSLSFARCGAQLFWFAGLGSTECFLLAAMAYDRFMAICKPLLYPVLMSQRQCYYLIAVSYVGGFGISVILSGALLNLHFCGPNRLDHFFCDGPPLIKLACGDKQFVQLLMFILVGSADIFTLMTIIVSYVYIISSIQKIQTVQGKWKTFSTCSSHLTCVFLLYGTVISMYLQPPSTGSQNNDWFVSVFYTLVIPMLNPLIYSVRNQQVKMAFKNILYAPNKNIRV